MMLAGLELREVRAFLTLAEELHFKRAGERLGVSPSRISQTIRTLETRVGGRLFERSSRRVRLTPAGEQLRNEAGPALRQLELMDAFVPPVTSSGARLRRIPRSFAELPVDIALGKGVHPTVPSFFEHYPHPGIVAVPMPELPPSQTALVWLSANASAKPRAFARAAADVLSGSAISRSR